MKVSEIMTTDVITVDPNDMLLDVSMRLSKNNITGAPVVGKGKKLSGIVTEFDIMKTLIECYVPAYISELANQDAPDGEVAVDKIKSISGISIKDIMTKDVITVDSGADAIEAARLITKNNINPLPVVNGEKELVGIVSRSDIVKYISDIFPKSKDTPPE